MGLCASPETTDGPFFRFSKSWKKIMRGPQKSSSSYFGGKPRRGGAIFGFLTLLIYFLLPLVYYVHLNNFPVFAAARFTTGLSDSLSQSAEPLTTPHDAEHCPICQAAERFQDYSCFSLLAVPDNVTPCHLSLRRALLPVEKALGSSLCVPRAPPIFL